MELEKTQVQEIDWDLLRAGNHRTVNQTLSNRYGGKIYSHESYAEDLCKIYAGLTFPDKEPQIDAVMRIIDIHTVTRGEMTVTLEGFIDATIKLDGERKFFAMLKLTQDEFVANIQKETWRAGFLAQDYHVKIEAVSSYTKASLYAGQTEKAKSEFMREISTPTSAYYGTITGKNHGGFIITVRGVEGFLPGSLAATNIVRDFDEMIGKQIPVMVEDYLKESSTFVFSYKKYISNILPQKIEKLDRNKKYTGTVTGVAKYGIFVEFDEIFTCLIHASKMSAELKEKFKNGEVKAHDTIDFWIREINAEKKIIATDEDLAVRQREIDDFKEKNLGFIKDGEVISVQPFGTLVRLQKDIVGMISQKEIKTKRKHYSVGDKIMVNIDRVLNDKIYLTIPNESQHATT